MRIVTWNLWHALNGRGRLFFGRLEAEGRTRLRHQLQAQLLSDLQADLICLQEVNPLLLRTQQLGSKLDLLAHSHWDSAGLKLKHWGPPFNLSSGLLTLIRAAYSPTLSWRRQLSGPEATLLRHPISLQFKEARQALFTEAFHPRGRMLIVNTHFHHGLEDPEQLVGEIKQIFSDRPFTHQLKGRLIEELRRGHQRRLDEARKLVAEISRRQSRYALIFILGDLNASPQDEMYQIFQEAGFSDLWLRNPDPGYTWHPEKNDSNFRLQAEFDWPLMKLARELPPSLRQPMERLILRHEQRPRRIDYVWGKALRGGLGLNKAQLIGFPNESGLAPSDHFGVCVDVDWSG